MLITLVATLIFNSLEAADRYAVANGNWTNTATWSTTSGGAPGATVPAANDNVFVQGGFTVTVNTNIASLHLLSIASGSTLVVNSNSTVSATTITVNGIYNNGSKGAITTTTMTFGASSIYIHNQSGGTIPTATWNISSTCILTRWDSEYNNPTVGLGQFFGNFSIKNNNTSYNCHEDDEYDDDEYDDDQNLGYLGVNMTIQGNFTVNSSRTRPIGLQNKNNTDLTLSIGGNLVIEQGYFFIENGEEGKANGGSSITVNGNFVQTGGTFDFNAASNSTALYVKGNFSHTGGTITETGCGSGSIIFTGNNTNVPQIFTSGGNVTNSINYTVNNGAILQMAVESTAVKGDCFTLNSGGTLDIKSTRGITNSATGTGSLAGNIRTNTRTFHIAANYIYSGASQNVGNCLRGARSLTLSGSGTKTFENENFTVSGIGTRTSENDKFNTGTNTTLPVTADLSIGSGVVLNIPSNKIIEVSNMFYICGEKKMNGTYGSSISDATYKDDTYFTLTTGKVNLALSALPIALTSFTAKPTSTNTVALNWTTSSEMLNKGFRIERQADGVNGKFENIGFVASKANGGNSQTSLYYNFIDASPRSGSIAYYRLAQENLSGNTIFSEVRVVKLNGETVTLVFPNPSNGAVNISRNVNEKKMNVQVIDMAGRMVQQFSNITDSNFKLNIRKSGIYNIKMTYPETGEQSVQRVVIER
jgi:hypothetical protein